MGFLRPCKKGHAKPTLEKLGVPVGSHLVVLENTDAAQESNSSLSARMPTDLACEDASIPHKQKPQT
ncbi:hypothetical protein MASR2M64_12720 [Candidatus Cloacimonadota bacterium]